MTNWWVISPYRSTEKGRPEWAKVGYTHPTSEMDEIIFEKAWKYDQENGTIAVGWKELGDTSQLSRDEFKQKFDNVYHGKNPQYAIWKIYNQISKGDSIVARRGRNKMVGIGTVAGDAYYDEGKGRERVGALTDDIYPNFIPVKWENTEEIGFDHQFFAMGALYKPSDDKIQEIKRRIKKSLEKL